VIKRINDLFIKKKRYRKKGKPENKNKNYLVGTLKCSSGLVLE
jgi:hypothetical protein